MSGLVERVAFLIKANLNNLVTRALRANSVAVIEQQIQDANESLDQLLQTIATIMADQRIDERKKDGLVADIRRTEEDALILLRAGKEGPARTLANQKLTKQDALAKTKASIASRQADLDKLDQAKTALKTKIFELEQTRDNVQQALEIAKTKGFVVKTFDQVAEVLEESGAEGIADWAEKVKTQADVRLDLTLEKYNALLNPTNPAVDAEIERMRAKLTQ